MNKEYIRIKETKNFPKEILNDYHLSIENFKISITDYLNKRIGKDFIEKVICNGKLGLHWTRHLPFGWGNLFSFIVEYYVNPGDIQKGLRNVGYNNFLIEGHYDLEHNTILVTSFFLDIRDTKSDEIINLLKENYKCSYKEWLEDEE